MTTQKIETPQTTHKPYQGYSAHVTDGEALAAFVAKFGRTPKELHRTGGGINIGPLRSKEKKG